MDKVYYIHEIYNKEVVTDVWLRSDGTHTDTCWIDTLLEISQWHTEEDALQEVARLKKLEHKKNSRYTITVVYE